MSNLYFYGSVVSRSLTIQGEKAVFVLSTQQNILGGHLDPPDELGSTSIRYDEPQRVRLCVWESPGTGDDAVTPAVVGDFVDNAIQPPDGIKAWEIGDGFVIAEAAVRKNADQSGGEQIERRFTLEVPFDKDKAPRSQPMGWLMEKRFTLSCTELQGKLELDEGEEDSDHGELAQQLPLEGERNLPPTPVLDCEAHADLVLQEFHGNATITTLALSGRKAVRKASLQANFTRIWFTQLMTRHLHEQGKLKLLDGNLDQGVWQLAE